LLTRVRRRLTYANVMATIAVFIALGGVGWAAATINSKDVIDNSLKSVDLKNGQGVTGADVAPDTFQAVGSEDVIPLLLQDDFAPEDCSWAKHGNGFAEPGVFRDQDGMVHLRGRVRSIEGTDNRCQLFARDSVISQSLPPGYRPAARMSYAVPTNNSFGFVDVTASGEVVSGNIFGRGFADSNVWLSLDGISFRCAPSGQNGCP
jgi:hypothetical protein